MTKIYKLLIITVTIFLISLNILYLNQCRVSNPLEKVWNVTKSKFMKTFNTDDRDSSLKEYKNIAFWTGYFGRVENWQKIFKRQLNNECEENRCNLIVNQSEMALADAIVFNAYDLRKRNPNFGAEPMTQYRDPDFPRREDQIFVLYSNEAPPYIQHIRFEDYDNFFNWTMSFRKDSDIFVPYGQFVKRTTKRPKEELGYVTEEELKNKNMGIWMVSHCRTPSKRSVFVNKLKSYISIDTYGKCGNKTCGQRTLFFNVKDDVESDPCTDVIRNYTFYLALENSLCTDYVTEKLYRPLEIGIVPIVLGSVDYSEHAPPNSYIDVKDFKNFEEFTSHIMKVASNAELYNEYLQWREDYDIDVGTPYKPLICDLCKKLHEQTSNSPRKTYPRIEDWLFKEGTCEDLRNIVKF